MRGSLFPGGTYCLHKGKVTKIYNIMLCVILLEKVGITFEKKLSSEMYKYKEELSNDVFQTYIYGVRERLLPVDEVIKSLFKTHKSHREEKKSEHLCVVCNESPRKIVLGCGHYCMCEKCSINVKGSSNMCPLCRNPIYWSTIVYE